MPPTARGGVGGGAATPRPRVGRTNNRLMGAVDGTGGSITSPVVVACGTLCAVLVGTAGVGGAACARTEVMRVRMRMAGIVVAALAVGIRTLHRGVGRGSTGSVGIATCPCCPRIRVIVLWWWWRRCLRIGVGMRRARVVGAGRVRLGIVCDAGIALGIRRAGGFGVLAG